MIINYITFNPVIILMPVISLHEPEGTYFRSVFSICYCMGSSSIAVVCSGFVLENYTKKNGKHT